MAVLRFNKYCISYWDLNTPVTADHVFQTSHWRQMVQVAFLAEVASVGVVVHVWLFISSISGYPLRCQFTNEGSRLIHFCKPFLGVFLSQPAACLPGTSNTPLRLFSDCSSCTWPPCHGIVADMMTTKRKLIAGAKVRFAYYLNHQRLCSLF